jgi:hypothetical protein
LARQCLAMPRSGTKPENHNLADTRCSHQRPDCRARARCHENRYWPNLPLRDNRWPTVVGAQWRGPNRGPKRGAMPGPARRGAERRLPIPAAVEYHGESVPIET